MCFTKEGRNNFLSQHNPHIGHIIKDHPDNERANLLTHTMVTDVTLMEY